MAEQTPTPAETPKPTIEVAPSPHLSNTHLTTRRMMLDVIIALVPVLIMAVWVFTWYAVLQVGLCVLSCMAAEYLLACRLRGRPSSLGDLSAAVTGVILGLSLPWSAPWYVAVIASFAAIGLGKVVFGGVGMNIFNPAMVGRAFVMISFSVVLGSGAYVMTGGLEVVSQATPLTAGKMEAAVIELWPLFVGNVNGSLGETSAIACLLGGIFLLVRRTASWEIPVSLIATVVVLAAGAQLAGVYPNLTVAHHLLGGSLLFGAFFIATDPVSSPMTVKGKFIFGAGTGAAIMVIRLFSGYPEGVMFAVLLMNGLVPLINNWTVPVPFGGPVPERK
ncbi:MAG: RnfABCDGE type electron transport complex subunit D [Thermoanaerobaculales bacterium]|jgi:electron transport complex protein RnfD|nr:RnfABCDGE type electron transport complex subunit D [Thermoanaerobaculales bacterium]